VEGKEGQPGTPSSFVMGEISKSASCAVDGETEKRWLILDLAIT
jgi:hypothetical protein